LIISFLCRSPSQRNNLIYLVALVLAFVSQDFNILQLFHDWLSDEASISFD
jgi:hypothetical protein